jgi:hypothetical protein
MPGQLRFQLSTGNSWAPLRIAWRRLCRSSLANFSSRMTTLASLASSRLKGSMFDEPTVAQ